MAAHDQLSISGVVRNLGELAAVFSNAGTHSADWFVGTSDGTYLIDVQCDVLAEIRRYQDEIAALEATHRGDTQRLQQLRERLNELEDARQYGADHGPSPNTVAHVRAVLNNAAPPVTQPPPQTRPAHGPIQDILLCNLDKAREKVILRIFEDLFTAEQISAVLREQLLLEPKIHPRFYVKRTKAHDCTNNGTHWELVSTTQPLGPLQLKELYVILRTGPYTLVLLGYEWRWKSDKTWVLDCAIARHSLQGIKLKRFEPHEEVGEHDWPLETDHYHCTVYGQIKSLHRTRLMLRDMGGRIRAVL
ncbi:hypothetical protein BS47DRAFT_1349377 [Hydnum rufescens UP504]|uniref:Uncharacterized protein n=1 Tax=Hydnum rufescens UP504 TaxID=1448309 RepID=A0A9P6DT74_9AGAM|nr:hypothetical protein BS47DRAFT_1349377 [Hydnum rufescens UP504]